jgi:DNA polymerase III subunit beta
MEFSVNRDSLLRELNLTQGVVERKTTIPILANLLCEAKGDQLTLTATDLELSIRTACAAKVKKEGAGTVPAKKLIELVRLLPDEEISFKLLENHWMQIVGDRRSYKLVGLSKENFPALPAFPSALARIPAAVIADAIRKTAFAISMEESRYTLNGALLVLKPESLVMVATDGHRLALVETEHKFQGVSNEVRVLVPKKAMAEIERLAAEEDDEADFEFAQDDSHLFFARGRRLLASRKLTGQFPNYEAVLPRDNNKAVVLDRNLLADTLRRVAQLADQRSRAVKFALAAEGVELSASSPDYGEAREAIEVGYKGEPLSIGFNAGYLLDFLSAAAEGPISIELKDEQSAGQLRPLGGEGETSGRYRYVVMPMRI